LVAILEWERVFPERGPRPQLSQRRAIDAWKILTWEERTILMSE
jgi:hypothetical protein